MMNETRSSLRDLSRNTTKVARDTSWARFTDHELTELDLQEIKRNVRGFVEVLIDWQKKKQLPSDTRTSKKKTKR